MGSASQPADPPLAALSRTLGRAVAERRCCLLTGACPGLPHEAVLGARARGVQCRSRAAQTGLQYCAVDSMTTSSTWRSLSQAASRRSWAGVLPNGRRSNASSASAASSETSIEAVERRDLVPLRERGLREDARTKESSVPPSAITAWPMCTSAVTCVPTRTPRIFRVFEVEDQLEIPFFVPPGLQHGTVAHDSYNFIAREPPGNSRAPPSAATGAWSGRHDWRAFV